jgi:hypothetical protein
MCVINSFYLSIYLYVYIHIFAVGYARTVGRGTRPGPSPPLGARAARGGGRLLLLVVAVAVAVVLLLLLVVVVVHSLGGLRVVFRSGFRLLGFWDDCRCCFNHINQPTNQSTRNPPQKPSPPPPPTTRPNQPNHKNLAHPVPPGWPRLHRPPCSAGRRGARPTPPHPTGTAGSRCRLVCGFILGGGGTCEWPFFMYSTHSCRHHHENTQPPLPTRRQCAPIGGPLQAAHLLRVAQQRADPGLCHAEVVVQDARVAAARAWGCVGGGGGGVGWLVG